MFDYYMVFSCTFFAKKLLANIVNLGELGSRSDEDAYIVN